MNTHSSYPPSPAASGQKQTLQKACMMKIPMVWELEAWSEPGLQRDLEYGRRELEPEMWKAGIARDVFLGLNDLPDAIDCKNLQSDIAAGTVTADAFSTFCSEHGLVDSAENELSAFRFLEYSYGRSVAWIHIPCDGAALVLAASINALLPKRGLILRESFTNAVVFNSEGRAFFGPLDHSEEWRRANKISNTA